MAPLANPLKRKLNERPSKNASSSPASAPGSAVTTSAGPGTPVEPEEHAVLEGDQQKAKGVEVRKARSAISDRGVTDRVPVASKADLCTRRCEAGCPTRATEAGGGVQRCDQVSGKILKAAARGGS